MSRAKKEKPAAVIAPPPAVRRNGLMFDIPQPGEPLPEIKPATAKPSKATPSPAERIKPAKIKRVCDPRLVSAARELRDRWLEQVNATPLIGCGKYDVSRAIDGPNTHTVLTDVEVITVRAMHDVRCLPPGQMAA